LEILKDAYDTEARLLEKLCSCLQQERDCLIAGRVRDLWPLREQKERICGQLKVQEKIIKEQSGEILKRGQKVSMEWIISSKKRIRNLKGEAASRSSENMKIVKDMLDFIDGLIDAIMSPEVQSHDYGRTQRMISYPRILFKEA